ncbi:MAG TPA: hypothetical protein VMY35_06425 [Phycisphaerae bacterium]|nr:hypothetical protein [Phycisphaerae bacterium]
MPADTDVVESSKSNTHWHDWEIGMLLARLGEGRPIEEIASALRRSPDAARRMLKRLIDGDAACPPGSGDDLQAVRLAAEARAEPQPPKAGASPALKAVREQYLALARSVGETNRALAQVEQLLQFSLALDLAADHHPLRPRELVSFLAGRRQALAILVLADELRKIRGLPSCFLDQARVQHTDLEEAGPAQRPNAAGELPLVSTGQGDGAKNLYPEDLTRPAGLPATGTRPAMEATG